MHDGLSAPANYSHTSMLRAIVIHAGHGSSIAVFSISLRFISLAWSPGVGSLNQAHRSASIDPDYMGEGG